MEIKKLPLRKRLFNKATIISSFLIICYLVLVVVFVYLLFQSRTPIPTTIWDTFSSSNLVVYLAMTFLLLVIIMYSGTPQTKLSLIIVHSVVSCMFKQIVCESRYGYDTWISLAYSKVVYSGEYPEYVPFSVYSSLPLFSKIYHVTERVSVYSFTVMLARMFSVDVNWSHLLFQPFLWGISIPLLMYKISKFLCKNEAIPLLAALLSVSPGVVGWGTTTSSNSIAWVLCLLLIYLSLKYLSFKSGLLLAFVIAFTTFITHEFVGVLSLSLILLAIIYQTADDFGYKHIRRVLLIGAFASLVLLVPWSMSAARFAGIAWQSSPRFSLEPLAGLSAYDAVFLVVFGAYADMNFSDAFIRAIVPFLGLVWLIYTLVEGGERGRNRKASVFMLLCLALVMLDYTILKVFMVNIPFGPERIWVFRDLLTIPFAAILISKTINYLSRKLASTKSVKISVKGGHFRNIASRSIFSVGFKGIVLLAIIILSLSSLITSAVYNAYPHSTYMRAWTTAHEIEAARYIEETTPRNETYVVLCEATTRLAGYAVVGPQNPRAYYYGPYESRVLKSVYNEFIDNPSLEPLYEARQKNNAFIVYVMISTFRPPVDGNPGVIEQIMDLPFFELYGVFGEDVYIRGKFEATVYVFRVHLPTEPIVKGIGPRVYIYNNQMYVNTNFTTDIMTYKTSYVATLTGLSSYHITGWPIHWSFESITPTPFVKYVDADKWINFTASETWTYSVEWTTNILYQPIGWKDDSFKEGWRVKRRIHWEEDPQISTDGDVLTMTGLFHEGNREGLVLERDVANVSTDDYPYVIVKWRSNGTCASVLVTYDGDVTNVLKPGLEWKVPVYGQHSEDWKVSIAKLPAGKTITSLRLYLDDYPSWTDLDGTYSVFYDYIMISNITKPEL